MLMHSIMTLSFLKLINSVTNHFMILATAMDIPVSETFSEFITVQMLQR